MARGEHPLNVGLDPFASTPRPWQNNWRKITTIHGGAKRSRSWKPRVRAPTPFPHRLPFSAVPLVTVSGVLRAWVRVA